MVHPSAWLIAVSCAGALGCGAVLTGSPSWFTDEVGKSSLEKRASFDLACAKEQLQYTPLGAHESLSYKTVGVTGCGAKVTYVWAYGTGWVLNSDAKPKQQAPQ